MRAIIIVIDFCSVAVRPDIFQFVKPVCAHDSFLLSLSKIDYCGDNQFHNGNDDQEDSEFCKHG